MATVSAFSLFGEGFPTLLERLRQEREEGLASRELALELRRYCEEHAPADRVDETGMQPALREGLAQMGAFALTAPTEHGGLGLGLGSACGVLEEVAKVSLSVAVTLGVHCGLAYRALSVGASEALKKKTLDDVAAGRALLAFAITEDGAGSDLGSVKSKATEDGGVLRLSGSKAWITNVEFARWATVLARTPGLGGPNPHTMLLVDLDTPGVGRGRNEKKLGLKGSSTGTLVFDQVAVPREHLLGDAGEGLKVAHAALVWGRTILCAASVAAAEEVLARAAAYTKERIQYRRPLFAHEVVRGRLTECSVDLLVARSVHAVSLANQGLGLPPEWVSGCAKVTCSELSWAVVDRALGLYGAQGYMEEVGVARALRDLRVGRIFEGANDVLLGGATSLATTWDWPATLPSLVPHLAPPVRALGEKVEAVYGALARLLQGIKEREGTRFLRQELRASWVGEALHATFAACAVLAVHETWAQGDSERDAAAVHLAVSGLCDRASAYLRRLEMNEERWYAKVWAPPEGKRS